MPVNNATVVNANNITNNLGDTQHQARKAYGAQATPQAGKQVTVQTPVFGDVRVTLSAAGRNAAAAVQGKAVASNEQTVHAVHQPSANQNAEAANAIKAYENAKQAANNTKQNPQAGQTQKAISRLGGAA
ncbi:MAG: hypothetical protein ABSB95_05050 [Dissulfurispiraceae bacterium]|jgi:hypothetical protein